jgi:hypothetical protein
MIAAANDKLATAGPVDKGVLLGHLTAQAAEAAACGEWE